MAYQIWAFTTAGAQAAVLENAFSIERKEKENSAPTLSFSLPADDIKAAFITTAYEVKVWNAIKERFEGLYILEDAIDRWSSSGKVIECNYSGVMSQLVKEDNITYDTTATPKTPTQIVTALLAMQERTPAITVGTIQPTTSFAIALENTNLLTALLKCVEYLGGYIEVDSSRALNWYTDPAGDPVREIRYQKNMRGVTRKRDFTSIVNKLYAYGYGETEAQLTLVDAGETYEYIQDATSQTAYGIRSKRVTDKRITHPSTLLRWAQKLLAAYKDPVYYYTVDVVNLAEHPQFTFDIEELVVGQIVRVKNSDLNNLNVNVKIVSVETRLDTPEVIRVELANATKTLADSIAQSADTSSIVNNVSVQIGAGQVTVQGSFVVEDWISPGTTKIVGDSITTGTISAATITLDDTGGSEGVIKSGNYSAGSAGWQIDGDGNAEFNDVTVRGTIGTASIGTGATVKVVGILKSDNFVIGTSGWYLDGSGSALFEAIGVTTGITCEGTISADSHIQTDTVFELQGNVTAGNARLRSIYTTDGVTLFWKDTNGTSHALY